jgi:hypothetical protein
LHAGWADDPMGLAARLGKNWYEGGVTGLRPLRRARWALPQDEGKPLMALRNFSS